MSRTLYLVRHGATAANLEGRYIGWDEHPLSPEGLAQAQRVAGFLAGQSPTSLYTSDLGRCVQTAEQIGQAAGLMPVADRRFRELNFGRFAGSTYAEIAARWPAELAAWLDDPERVAPPEGESLASLRQRVLAALPQEDGAVLVTHGGVVRTVLAHLTGRAFWSWAVPPGSVYTVRLAQGRSLVEPQLWPAHGAV